MRKSALALAMVATLLTSQGALALTVSWVSLTNPVHRGDYATATVRTRPGARCDIDVIYKSGESTAAGLGNKTVGSTGRVSWRWKVGTNTTPGYWPVRVTCRKNGASDTVSRKLHVIR